MAATNREQMAFRPAVGVLARIDAVKGELSRNEWVCRVVEAALGAAGGRPSGPATTEPAGSSPVPGPSPRLDLQGPPLDGDRGKVTSPVVPALDPVAAMRAAQARGSS